MHAYVDARLRKYTSYAKNIARHMHRARPMQLFSAPELVESVAADILDPLPKSKRGEVFIMVQLERSSKLTQVVTMQDITAYDVAVACT